MTLEEVTTLKEAIKRLKEVIKEVRSTIQPFLYDNEAKDYILKALEQEPCEDAVSRQAVIDEIEFYQINPQHFDFVSLIDNIKDLPSVNPQEPKTGHWVDKFGGVYRCSECRELIELDCEITTPKSIERFRYCPNCGARMEG